MSKISKAQKRAAKHAPDAILAMYVRIANEQTEDKTIIGVTLTVGGAVITGQIVADWAWAEAAHQLATAESDSDVSGFSAWRDRLIERRDETAAAIGDLEDDVEPTDEQRIAHADATPGFIHLRDAQVFVGEHLVPTKDGLWRGRLTSVDGWFVGRWSTEPRADG